MLKTIMKLHDLADRDLEDLEEECPVCPGGQKLTSSKVIKRHIIGELWNSFSYLDECLDEMNLFPSCHCRSEALQEYGSAVKHQEDAKEYYFVTADSELSHFRFVCRISKLCLAVFVLCFYCISRSS